MNTKVLKATFLFVALFSVWFSFDATLAAVDPESMTAFAATPRYCNYLQPEYLELYPQFTRRCSDVCPNIIGIQSEVPDGYQLIGGQCIPNTPPPPPPQEIPTCALSVNPSSIVSGDSAALSWTSSNTATISIDNGIGSVTPVSGGSTNVSPSATVTYIASATMNGQIGICSTTLTVTQPVPVDDALVNGGFETDWPGGPAGAFDWQAYGNGYTRVAVSHSGSWGIRLRNSTTNQSSGAYQRIDLDQTSTEPVFVGGYVRGRNIDMASGTWLGASLYAEVYFTDGTVGYWNSVPNSGSFNWRWVGFNTGTVAHLQKPIDYIFIIPILASASGTAYFDDIVVTEIQPTTMSAVTIMFDDGGITDFTEAKPVLDSHGFNGTVAIPVGDLGNPGNMTSAQVQVLQSSGWEVVSHAINNDTNLVTDLTSSQAQSAIVNSKTQLQTLGLTIRNFAWPFGAYNAQLISFAQNAGYTSTRTFEVGNNPQGAFPYDIKVRQVTNATTPEQISAWLSEGKANNRWEILSFHMIVESGDDQYYTTPSVFADMMDAVSASGMPVVTYNEGLSLFATRGGPNPINP